MKRIFIILSLLLSANAYATLTVNNDGGASNITATAATLGMDITGTNASGVLHTNYFAHGTSDQTTNLTLWGFILTNTTASGVVQTNLTGLASNSDRYYRSFARDISNGLVWAANTIHFKTLVGGITSNYLAGASNILIRTVNPGNVGTFTYNGTEIGGAGVAVPTNLATILATGPNAGFANNLAATNFGTLTVNNVGTFNSLTVTGTLGGALVSTGQLTSATNTIASVAQASLLATNDILVATKVGTNAALDLLRLNNGGNLNNVLHASDTNNLANASSNTLSLAWNANLASSNAALSNAIITVVSATSNALVNSLTSLLPKQSARILNVATNGNDSTGNGSWSNAYATINKAMKIARTLSPSQAQPVVIRVATGRYTETAETNDTPYVNIKGDGCSATYLVYADSGFRNGPTNQYSVIEDIAFVAAGGNAGPYFSSLIQSNFSVGKSGYATLQDCLDDAHPTNECVFCNAAITNRALNRVSFIQTNATGIAIGTATEDWNGCYVYAYRGMMDANGVRITGSHFDCVLHVLEDMHMLGQDINIVSNQFRHVLVEASYLATTATNGITVASPFAELAESQLIGTTVIADTTPGSTSIGVNGHVHMAGGYVSAHTGWKGGANAYWTGVNIVGSGGGNSVGIDSGTPVLVACKFATDVLVTNTTGAVFAGCTIEGPVGETPAAFKAKFAGNRAAFCANDFATTYGTTGNYDVVTCASLGAATNTAARSVTFTNIPPGSLYTNPTGRATFLFKCYATGAVAGSGFITFTNLTTGESYSNFVASVATMRDLNLSAEASLNDVIKVTTNTTGTGTINYDGAIRRQW